MLTTFIGGVTFTGSIVAYGKLSERLAIKKTSLITKLFTTIFYISLFYLIYSTFFTDIFEPNFDFLFNSNNTYLARWYWICASNRRR